MAQVLDASVAVAWCAPSQATSLTRAALVGVIADGALVPASFWYEVFHGLSRLKHRGIVEKDDIDRFIASVLDLDLSVDPARDASEMVELYVLSQRLSLNIYDTGYLELALRSGLPLATGGRALESAARKMGVAVFGT
jgi:predicted nucleic acid-binding protein